MDSDELIRHVAGDLELYVQSGTVNPDVVGDALADAAFGERIAGFGDLLYLHLLLDAETVAFAEKLPGRLRSLNTGTKTERTLVRSEVSERIDWGETIQARNERNPDDTTLFVTQSRYENYDLAENIVLKRAANILERGLRLWEEELQQYDWDSGWTDDILERTRATLERNRNLDRIREPETNEPSSRMLTTALQAREPLYRDAAEVVIRYNGTVGGQSDPELIEELLKKTLIVPLDDNGGRVGCTVRCSSYTSSLP
ncbi:hypothetical protein [Halosegnis marinus]|uniref:hypothetical protein n=1 Tax=Halosegnis marinus TaxID=3034023 RepID=UPI00362048FA